jgi:hypothetical protein
MATSRSLSLAFVAADDAAQMVTDALNIAIALRDRGHVIDFATSSETAGRIHMAGFTVEHLRVDRLGRLTGLDPWLRAGTHHAVHVFGHAGVWSAARAARRLRIPLYWTVGDRAPASAPPAGVVIAYSAHAGRRLVANRRLRLEHVVVEPARIACGRPLELAEGEALRGRDAVAQRQRAAGRGPAPQLIVAACPEGSTTIHGLEQAASAVAELRREGHDVRLLRITGERLGPREPQLRSAVAVLGSGRGAYEGMLADRPTLVLGPNGYAGDCTTDDVEVLSAYDFTGANVTRRNDLVGVERLVASLRPLLERRPDERVWLGSGWARARVGADVAAATYEDLYLRRRHIPHGGSVALHRYEAARLAARPLRAASGLLAKRGTSRRSARRSALLAERRRAVPLRRSRTAPVRPAARDTVVHVFASAGAVATRAQVDAVVRLQDTGWTSIVVLPSASDWSEIAQVCANAGARVVRIAAAPSGVAPALHGSLRMTAVLRGWLDQWDAAIVHAHDDAAALHWALAARSSGVPLVWDANLDVRAAPLDRIRFATASYVVLDGCGRRLSIGQRLPPHHYRARSPQREARAVADAYELLTGRTVTMPVSPVSTRDIAVEPVVVDLSDPVDVVR